MISCTIAIFELHTFAMVYKFCAQKLVEYEKFDQVHGTFMTRFCVINLTFSITAALGTTVAYIRIYKAIRYHQNRIRVQPQATNQMQAYTAHQEKISAIDVMAVNGVCYLLLSILCCTISLMVDGLRTSFFSGLSSFSLLGSLKFFIKPGRYLLPIRKIEKITLKEIFRLGPAQRPSFMYNRHLNMKI